MLALAVSGNWLNADFTAECSSEETVLPEIALALAVSRNWVNPDFIGGASLNSRLDMAVPRTCPCLL